MEIHCGLEITLQGLIPGHGLIFYFRRTKKLFFSPCHQVSLLPPLTSVCLTPSRWALGLLVADRRLESCTPSSPLCFGFLLKFSSPDLLKALTRLVVGTKGTEMWRNHPSDINLHFESERRWTNNKCWNHSRRDRYVPGRRNLFHTPQTLVWLILFV